MADDVLLQVTHVLHIVYTHMYLCIEKKEKFTQRKRLVVYAGTYECQFAWLFPHMACPTAMNRHGKFKPTQTISAHMYFAHTCLCVCEHVCGYPNAIRVGHRLIVIHLVLTEYDASGESAMTWHPNQV